MSTQISIKLSDKMFKTAKDHVNLYGYDSLQDFIRETIREKLFEDEKLSSKNTLFNSEKSLAKNWLSEKEDKAWEHLQKEK